ncbi:carbohydrate kinase family protein [Streptomyces mirabilis]|uniref:carbohydrate kinase family protein n=1 Tax=Streptomyces mirabilis TaxID=68239 RepID=UPI0033E601C1
MDLTPTRTADGAASFQPRPDGSGLNVAAGLGRLAVPAALLARLSDDHFGGLLRAHLAASGTRLTHVLPSSDPSTLAAVQLREDGSACYSFHTGGAADRGPSISPRSRTAVRCLRGRAAPRVAGTAARTPALHPRRTDSPGGGPAAGVRRPECAAGSGHRPSRLPPAVRRVGGARRRGESERRGSGLAPPG